MNAIMERWVRTCRAELLNRTLIVNRSNLLHALRDYELFYNEHRPTGRSAPRHPYARSPNQSSNRASSTASTSNDVTDWAASCTNTSMQPELHGRHFRHLQRSYGAPRSSQARAAASAAPPIDSAYGRRTVAAPGRGRQPASATPPAHRRATRG